MGFELASEDSYIKSIWLALNASYALEAFRFMVSFATSLGMVENKLFIGNGNIITSILQDEMLHTDWTAYIINQVVKDDPRFAQAKLEWTCPAQCNSERKLPTTTEGLPCNALSARTFS